MLSNSSRPGHALPLLLLRAFQELVDELHTELARTGHPDARPMHGFVLQAVGPEGTTAVELARALGVTKQAAGRTVAGLEEQGYLVRATDPADSRRKVVRLSARGQDLLERSAAILDDLRRRRADTVGADRIAALEDTLAALGGGAGPRWDAPAWFGARPD